jgi:GTP-binding protein
MLDLLTEAEVPFIVVATKMDRVKRSKQVAHFKTLAAGLRIQPSQILPFSSTAKEGQDQVWQILLDVVGDFKL